MSPLVRPLPERGAVASLRWPLFAGLAWHFLSAGAWAQTTDPVVPASVTPAVATPPAAVSASPTAVLMNQASYWRLQGRGDLALAALRRALLVDPHNAEALALSAELHAEQGERSAAQADLTQLRAVRPEDPRLVTIERSLRLGPIDQTALAQARELARQGHVAEAVERYRALFKGAPPPDHLAVEYDQVLAATEGGWDAARSGLARHVYGNPQDTHGQLAYAQLLTYRPATRTEGIGRLAILANNPATAETAATAWRQALDWLPVDTASIPLYQAYLAGHPDDPGLTRRLADARNPRRTPTDEAGADRQRGFDALRANRLGDADGAFEAALVINPRDSEALGGLGLVRQRQGRGAGARDLLERAIAAAPEKAGQWQSALNGVTVGTEMASAAALTRNGQLAAAAQQLRDVISRGGDVTGAQAMLADIQARSGDLAGAEANWRAVLARQPNNGTALVGLAGVLNRRGHTAEADDLLARAEATGQGQAVGQARSQQLRLQAQQTPDPGAAVALLRAASAAAPADPWIRLDLARALVNQGHAAEGREEMAALTDTAHPSVDALHAAALFALEDEQPEAAAALAERIPARSRSANMDRILATARFKQQVRQAVAGAAISGEARQSLLALAAAPDPDGSRGAAIVRAFGSLSDPAGAREAVAVALAANRNPTPAARLAYASALLSVGLEGDAGRLVASVDMSSGLTPDQRVALAKLQDGIAIRSSDTLNQAGRTAAAYDQLSPALRRSPADPDLNLALGRLYQTARDPKQALAIAQMLLRRDPGNMDARRAAVSAAIELGDLREADALVQAALAAKPEDPRTWLMSADLARAHGDNGRVLSDLRTAQNLRRQQTGSDQPGSFASGRMPSAGVPARATAGGSNENPFRGDSVSTPPIRVADASGLLPAIPGGSAVAADPMSEDIARAIKVAEAEVVPQINLGPSYRVRSGSNGLDHLNEITVPLAASFSPGGYGRMTLGATPTFLSNGKLDGTTGGQRQFGTLVLGGNAQGDQNAQGVGLSAAFKYRWLAVDAGSTPLGFRTENAVGGVELSPDLSNGLRLRSIAERRPVTDSLLSYAGTVDPGTRRTFGGVMRTRGHTQLELSAGLANFYAGGGYSQLTGENVASNTETEFGAGGSYPIYRTATDELRAGLDLVYFSYAKNLDHFTLGQGGYFSPQSYFAALIPLEYTRKLPNLSWSVGGNVGLQNYSQNSSPVFPNNAGLQAQLFRLASSDPTIVTAYPSTSQSGVVGGAHASIEYQVDPSLWIGGLIRYDRSGNWNETQATIFTRYVFNATE